MEPSQQYQEILNRYQKIIASPSPAASPPPSLPPMPPSLPASAPVSPKKSPKSVKFFKFLFFLSLLSFLAVAAATAYIIITQKPLPLPGSTAPSPTPTPSFCEVNDKRYQVGQSFTTADGCNTCTCLQDLTIGCSELECQPTPTTKQISIEDAKDACIKLMGEKLWDDKFKECNGGLITQKEKLESLCHQFGGTFFPTASTCRHVVSEPCGPEVTYYCSFLTPTPSP